MQGVYANREKSPLLALTFMVLVAGVAIWAILIWAMFPGEKAVTHPYTQSMANEVIVDPVTVVIPGAGNHTRIVLDLHDLPVDRKAKSFSRVAAEQACKNETFDKRAACERRVEQETRESIDSQLAERRRAK